MSQKREGETAVVSSGSFFCLYLPLQKKGKFFSEEKRGLNYSAFKGLKGRGEEKTNRSQKKTRKKLSWKSSESVWVVIYE